MILRGGGTESLSACGAQVLAGGAQVQAFELEVEATSREPQLARCARDIAAVFAKRFGNHTSLDFGQRVRERHVFACARGDYGSDDCARVVQGRAGALQFRREMVGREGGSVFRARDYALNLVAELAHVARPVRNH